MPKLVIRAGGAPAVTVELKSGANAFGRAPGNEIRAEDGSISARHCEFLVEKGSVIVKDLGSTNGTFLDGQLITRSILLPGQVLRAGSVEITLEGATPYVAVSTAPVPELPTQRYRSDGTPLCLNHPDRLATLECSKCASCFCELCIRALRRVGGAAHLFCPSCGGECYPMGHRARAALKQMKFFNVLASAFSFPFTAKGLVLMTVGTGGLVTQVLLRQWALPLTLCIAVFLLLAFYKLVLSSAEGQEAVECWPGFSSIRREVVVPMVHWAVVLAVCFGPGVGCILAGPTVVKLLGFQLLVLGAFYFPMALLVVVVRGTLSALRPSVVMTAVFKVPSIHLTLAVLVALIVGMILGQAKLSEVIRLPLLAEFVTGLLSLYLFLVVGRAIGLTYFTCEQRFGWAK